MSGLEVRVLDHLGEVEAEAWDRLAGEDDPFVEHGFLRGLETSGSVGSRESGWVPRHVVVYDEGELVGAMPLYEKYDSYGEYIFDWAWARAAEQARLRYYPKLVAAVPFTPATGRRLLLAGGRPEGPVIDALVDGVREVSDACDASSVHLLFVTGPERAELAARDFMPRSSYQFHWQNDGGWCSFDDFLASMRAPARKQVRRERRQAAEHGLTLSLRRGTELGPREWQTLWELYRLTTSEKWAIPYLTREFFLHLETTLPHRVVASFAHEGDEPVAGTLMFQKGAHLYGRYWGSKRELRAMHFELCYYRPIEWCLQNGLRRFEAGAQGQHKLKRGLMPAECHSAHWIRHPALRDAVARFLPREHEVVSAELGALSEHGPFRRG